MRFLCNLLFCKVLLASCLAEFGRPPKTIVAGKVVGEVLGYIDVDLNRYSDLIVKTAPNSLGVLVADEDTVNFTQAHRFSVNLSFEYEIENVAVADFDGDLFSDLLISSRSSVSKDQRTAVHVCWGSQVQFSCVHDADWLFDDHPQVMDCNCDQLSDILVISNHGQTRACMLGDGSRMFKLQSIFEQSNSSTLRRPFLPSLVDITGDLIPEMVLPLETSNESSVLVRWEVWTTDPVGRRWVQLPETVLPPLLPKQISLFKSAKDSYVIGAPLFDDFNADGTVDLLVPMCPSLGLCKALHLHILMEGRWYLQVLNLPKSGNNHSEWHVKNVMSDRPVAMRSGDFNADGYPDLVVVLESDNGSRGVFIIENGLAESDLKESPPRVFRVLEMPVYQSRAIEDAAFFDLMETGTLDVVVLEKHNGRRMSVFVSSIFEYESTFVKVQLNSPLCNGSCLDIGRGPAVVWVGSTVRVQFKTLDGTAMKGSYSPLYSSTHRSLLLPYQVFGLGPSLSFIESMSVGIMTWSRSTMSWPHVIPNSRLYVIPYPADQPFRWYRRLYVMPGRVLRESIIAFSTVFGAVGLIVLFLQRREMLQDKKEREMMINRFHFDAM